MSGARRVRIAIRGRSPFVVFLLAGSILSGLATLSGVAEPASLQRAVSPVVLVAWSVGLVGGGVITLAGLFIEPITGLLVERLGLLPLVGGGAAYSVALLASNGRTGIVAAAWVASFTAAGLARVVQITRDVRRLRVATTEGA